MPGRQANSVVTPDNVKACFKRKTPQSLPTNFAPIPASVKRPTILRSRRSLLEETGDSPRIEPRTLTKCLTERNISKSTPLAISFVDDHPKTASITTPITEKHNYDHSLNLTLLRQCYQLEYIGKGSFGTVHKAVCKTTFRMSAVKEIKKEFNVLSREEVLREAQKHQHLPRHENIVQFLSAWEERGVLYIETELCAVNLAEVAKKSTNCDDCISMPETAVRTVLIDMLQALERLHAVEKVHRDIKPENILLLSEDGPPVWKLADFGLVFDLAKDTYHSIDNDGDGRYLAKEVVCEGIITKAADIFSLGITILEIACDLDINTGDIPTALRDGILPNDLLEHVSDELYDVISRMLAPEHEERPSAEELLQNKSIKSWIEERNKPLVDKCVCQTMTVAASAQLKENSLNKTKIPVAPEVENSTSTPTTTRATLFYRKTPILAASSTPASDTPIRAPSTSRCPLRLRDGSAIANSRKRPPQSWLESERDDQIDNNQKTPTFSPRITRSKRSARIPSG